MFNFPRVQKTTDQRGTAQKVNWPGEEGGHIKLSSPTGTVLSTK